MLLDRLLPLPPQQALNALKEEGDPTPLLLDLAETVEQLAISDLGRARRAAETIIAIADQHDSPRCQARARRAYAQVLAYANEFEQALDVLADAEEHASQSGKATELALLSMARQHALARLGQYHDAIASGVDAREIFIRAGDALSAAKADANIGVIHRMRGDPRAALARFEAARAAFAGAENSNALARLDSNRAEALLDLNQFLEAEQAFQSALQSFEVSGAARAAAIVRGNIADLLSRQGRIDQALNYFEQARREFEREASGGTGDLGRLMAEQAETLLDAGLIEAAIDNYRIAIPLLDEHGMTWEYARAQLGLTRAQARRGQLDEAQESAAAAMHIFQSLEHAPGVGLAILLQGEIASERGDLARARHLFEEALKRLSDRPAEQAMAQHGLARLRLLNGDSKQALALVETAIATARSHRLAPLLAELLHLRARIRLAQGERAAGLDDLRAAIEQIERVRGSLQAERLRTAFLGHRTAPFDDLISTLLESTDHASRREAFHTVERAKGRSLLDLMHGALEAFEHASDRAHDAVEQSMLQELVRTRQELNALYSRLFEMGPSPSSSSAPVDQEAIDAAERRIEELEQRLAATRSTGGLFAPAASVDDVAPLLTGPMPAALVEFFTANGQVGAFVLKSHEIHVVRELITETALHEMMDDLTFQMNRGLAWIAHAKSVSDAPVPRGDSLVEDMLSELRRLHEAVWTPLSKHMAGIKRVVIIPHDRLHAAPFAALHDGQEYLIDRHEIMTAPSASLLVHLRRSRTTTPPGAFHPLIIGVADERAPMIADEVQALALRLPRAEVLLGEAATIEQVKTATPRTDLLHVAAHAYFIPDRPMSSGIRLADGVLTARDIYGLRLNGAVVTLSGCDTARTAVASGDELAGLIRAFFAAGASALLVSLWPLHDMTAANLMARAYELWQNESVGRQGAGGLAAALRQAQIEARRDQPHPALWSSLVLIGGV